MNWSSDYLIPGISQRDVRSHYAHIGQQKNEMIADIKHFFDTHMKNKFFDNDC